MSYLGSHVQYVILIPVDKLDVLLQPRDALSHTVHQGAHTNLLRLSCLLHVHHVVLLVIPKTTYNHINN